MCCTLWNSEMWRLLQGSSGPDKWNHFLSLQHDLWLAVIKFWRVTLNYIFKVYSCKSLFSLLRDTPPAFSLRASVASPQMPPVFCVGGTLRCWLEYAAGRRPGPCHSHALYLGTATEGICFSPLISLVSLIFLENARIVKIELVRMGLKSSPFAKTMTALKAVSLPGSVT